MPAVDVDPDGDQRVHTCQRGDRVGFFTGQAQALRRLPGHELQGEYSHADEVTRWIRSNEVASTALAG